jgi:hypothetical protein
LLPRANGGFLAFFFIVINHKDWKLRIGRVERIIVRVRILLSQEWERRGEREREDNNFLIPF